MPTGVIFFCLYMSLKIPKSRYCATYYLCDTFLKIVGMKYLVKIPRFISVFILLLSLMASTCEPDIPEPPVTNGSNGGSGSGNAVCSGSYRSPVNDAQLDSFCGAAYAYRCLDGLALSSQQVQSVCSIYNSIKEPGTPNCPYCQ